MIIDIPLKYLIRPVATSTENEKRERGNIRFRTMAEWNGGKVMMNVYVVMKAVWKDDGYPEEVDICDVYSSKDTAIYCIEKLVTDRYAYSLSKYHEEPIIEIVEGDVYEKIVWDGDKHGYERYWVEEKVLKGARND